MFRTQQEALSWIRVANAASDADRALIAGDHRLLGVYGYATSVPGADSAAVWNSCGVRMIEGTSDYVAHDAFATAPWAYAERYNARMLARSGCGVATSVN